jgi:outer membrane protein OmpA-like peptidoglycan-associated protein/Tol biopolymer transport system component
MKKSLYTLFLLLAGFSASAQNGQPININTDFIEVSPTISGDGKTMVFQSNRDGGFRLYESTLQADGKWSEPKALTRINSHFAKPSYTVGGPCLSQDGKTLYFCAMYYAYKTDMDIYVSKKNNRNEWTLPANIGKPITTEDSETFPSISPDGKKLFYTLTSSKGHEAKCPKIMMSELDARQNWSKPVEVAAPLNSSCDKSPRLMYDNKTMFYSSSKNGNYDLFRSEMSASNTWSQPVALDFVNTEDAQLYASLTSSEDYLYYSQKGDIYKASVPDNFKLHGLGLEGKFIDVETGKPVSGQLFLIDTLAKDTLKTLKISDSYKIFLPAGKKYKLLATANSYYDYSIEYATSLDEAYKALNVPIKIKPKKKEIVFKVSDKENSKGLKVKIKVTNVETKEETIVEANAGRDGKYAVSLREGNKYNVEISSVEGGYAFSTTTIDVPLTNYTSETVYAGGTKDTTAVSDAFMPNIDIQLQPLKDDTKLTLNDIYFLFNKFQLEEESYKELDRVVGLMKSNPSARIEIAAHTDDIGSDDFNNNLSAKRAQEIVKYLNAKGIPSSRLQPKGYGKTRPIDPANTEEARAKNRRVELKILDIN